MAMCVVGGGDFWKAFPVAEVPAESRKALLIRLVELNAVKIIVRLWVRLRASGDFDAVAKKRNYRGKTFFCAALAAGQIHDQRGTGEAGDCAREPCIPIALSAEGAHGFCEAGRFTIDDAARCFRRAIAGT